MPTQTIFCKCEHWQKSLNLFSNLKREAEIQKSLKYTLMPGTVRSSLMCDLLWCFSWADFFSSKLLFAISKAFHGSMPWHVFGARQWKHRAVLKRGFLQVEWSTPNLPGLQLSEVAVLTLTLWYAEMFKSVCGGGRHLLWYNSEQARPQG